MINEWLLRFFNAFHHNAHPMAMVSGVVASMSAFYHDTMDIHNPRHREIFAHRIIAKIPTIAAAAHKHSLGQPFIYPRNDLDYAGNLLNMLFAVPCEPYKLDPIAAKALDLLFVLHADHEQNASTSTVRLAGSTGANPYAAISAGVSALWGPAHGGANEAVLAMLEQIGTVDNIPKYLAMAKDKSNHFRLMGFGHRVYKNFDPRAKIIREMCHKVLAAARAQRQPAAGAGAAPGGDRAQGRVLHRAQALSERRFLLRRHLQRDRHSALDVHGDVRHRAHGGLGGALAGDDLRSRACASAGRGSCTPGPRSATTSTSASAADGAAKVHSRLVLRQESCRIHGRPFRGRLRESARPRAAASKAPRIARQLTPRQRLHAPAVEVARRSARPRPWQGEAGAVSPEPSQA